MNLAANKILRRIQLVFGYCPQCGMWFVYPKRRRWNTNYEDDESNHITWCKKCFDEAEEYWAERWRDYYSGLM